MRRTSSEEVDLPQGSTLSTAVPSKRQSKSPVYTSVLSLSNRNIQGSIPAMPQSSKMSQNKLLLTKHSSSPTTGTPAGTSITDSNLKMATSSPTTQFSKSEAILRLRWRAHDGQSTIIGAQTVDDIQESLERYTAQRVSSPLNVPFEVTKAQALSLKIADNIYRFKRFLKRPWSFIVEKLRLEIIFVALSSIYSWMLRGLDARERFRDHDGEITVHRNSYFAYWLSSVHVIVFVTSISIFGYTSWGFTYTVTDALVKMPTVRSEKMLYFEEQNPWLGPSVAQLVLLGARYPPCMRKEPRSAEVVAARARESETACCVRMDGGGCYQSSKENCEQNSASRWMKWDYSSPGPNRRTKGTVCGLDPRIEFCPGHNDDFSDRWPTDITEWPADECGDKKPSKLMGERMKSKNRHMFCQLQARPCCYGIRGQCAMTTWEHCDLLRGTYHPDKFLCGQADCLMGVCGMSKDAPYQWYRGVTSLFVHEGLFHLVFSLWFQLHVMNYLDEVVGLMMIPIFLVTGVSANILAGLVAPTTVRAGPTSLHAGTIAILQVLIVLRPSSRGILVTLAPSLILQSAIVMLCFLPWFDIYGSIIGFLLGIILGFSMLVSKSTISRYARSQTPLAISGWCSILTLAIGGFILFWGLPRGYMEPIVINHQLLRYLDCIPFTQNFCKFIDPATGYNQTVYAL